MQESLSFGIILAPCFFFCVLAFTWDAKKKIKKQKSENEAGVGLKEVRWSSKEMWRSSGQITRSGFESWPGASPQCGLRGGRSHCDTV